MKRGEKWFSEKLRKNVDTYLPYRELPLPSLCCKGDWGGLPSEIALPGEASSPKLCIEGWVRTLKNQKNIFGL